MKPKRFANGAAAGRVRARTRCGALSPRLRQSPQQTGRSVGGPKADAALVRSAIPASTAGPDAEACTVSKRPGHSALNGPNTSPATSTRTQPASEAPGRNPASGLHQSLRTTTLPGVHHRHPSPAAAARATASCAAPDNDADTAGSGPCVVFQAPWPAPSTAACAHTARNPSEAAASAWARAPLTSSAWAASNNSNTITDGHTISKGSTSARSPRWRARRR